VGVDFVRFVCRVTLACFLLTACGEPEDVPEQTFDRTYSVEPTTSIRILNGDGSIRVYGAAATDLRVQALKRAYAPERLDKIDIRVSIQPGQVSITTDFPPKTKWGLSDRSGTVDYSIVVPQTAKLDQVELSTGEILIEGMRSERAQTHLATGRLFLHNCFGNVRATVDTGPLGVIYDWWEPVRFSLEAKSVSGGAWAAIPGNAAFHLLAQTRTGKIVSDFAMPEQRTNGPVRKIDNSIGVNPTARFAIDVGDGNIRIFKAYP
jgi:hypothetical protein